ncbi:uncharacterized protein LOC116189756 isoform X2 [Punica granatum]|uniref:Uncharacterized protein LOC116188066 isoform X2 n=1 Tax=Punica granatum TaxID=22663 RepID=A0A6P8C1T9_PUNGR|nr:uncharacterized protein LOC116188066 isoform X2 [Punica granatum]XP_031375328.1 uncharacterized protein LOC116189756 isoform X2 [Punica granatum]
MNDSVHSQGNLGPYLAATMGPSGSNGQLAPRTIRVQKFAEARGPELERLHSIVAQRLGNNFRSQRNKRRRTTSHDNQASNRRRRKRQKGLQCDNPELKTQEKLPRRVRRRNELRMNPQSGFSTSGDGTKRLRTHVWNAKRFTMTKLWGFHLPLGLHGRGRGSRALLKRCREGVVVHDASYHLAVQLDGPEDSLISILRMVLVPSPRGHPIDGRPSVLCGSTYESAMLHHVGEPTGRPICPVICIWRPLNEKNLENAELDYSDNGHTEPRNSEGSKLFRQLWVWIHASAFGEGYNALKSACQKEMDAKSISINCFSLEGRIAKLELMGSGAFQLLKKILHPISCVPGKSFQLKKHSEAVSNDDKMKDHSSLKEEQFSDSTVLSLVVKDPRAYREEGVTDVKSVTTTKVEFTSPVQVEEHTIPSDDHGVSPPSSLVYPEIEDLWDASRGIKPPVDESVLCQERHDKRLEFYCLSDPNCRTSSTLEAFQSSTCPIMLLRKHSQAHSQEHTSLGWFIILPLSWVKAFWVPLVTMGAHAIGLREKRWISCEASLPYFPSDFPDCSAYTSLVAAEAAASSSKADLRPRKLRPMKIPIPLPWSTVQTAYDEVPSLEGNSQIPAGREIYNMRTSRELGLFNERFGGHLLLFPHGVGNEGSLQKALINEVVPCQDGIIQFKDEKKLYFLRVILRAFREGAFEEGAVVCTPHFSDISLWSSRPENYGKGLQISESAVASYFKEESSGTWVLQTPLDPLARESHRRGIGFVTTGFVRGSKKPAAVAICEATSLARLRAEQWSEMHVKRRKEEIYVLVRNLRSSAYRLALATIVLEHQKEDVKSL